MYTLFYIATREYEKKIAICFALENYTMFTNFLSTLLTRQTRKTHFTIFLSLNKIWVERYKYKLKIDIPE